MNVEDVFSSKLRMKIIKIIVDVGELNISEIARRLRVNYMTTAKHLKILEEEELLMHTAFGRIRLYCLNEESTKAMAVQNLIEIWQQENRR